jgi:hypothetical protein
MSRKRFTFWLDDTKHEQNELIEQVDQLKQTRSFASTIRDGIRLVSDLRKGSLDVLFELFPFVRAEFLQYVESLQINVGQGEKKTLTEQNEVLQTMVNQQSNRVAEVEAENARLQAKIEGLQAVAEESEDYIAELEAELDKQDEDTISPIQQKLDRLEQLLLQQGHVPIETTSQPVGPPADENNPSRPSGGGGLKPIGQGNSVGIKPIGGLQPIKLPPPNFDDDDDLPELTITKAKSDGSATQNFLNSLRALQEQ